MKTKILFTAIVAAMLSTSIGYAQRVTSVSSPYGHGYALIDCKGSMPVNNCTTESKSENIDILSTQQSNTKVTERFVVAHEDCLPQNFLKYEITFGAGVKGCSDLEEGAGRWRLPTLRELQLMFVLRIPLDDSIYTFEDFVNKAYWCATQWGTSECFYVDFKTGTTTRVRLAENFKARVRCVSDRWQ